MTKNPKLLIAVVALVAVLGAYWMLVLSPKREEISKLDAKVTAAKNDLQTAQATLATYEQAQSAYKTNYATVVRLGVWGRIVAMLIPSILGGPPGRPPLPKGGERGPAIPGRRPMPPLTVTATIGSDAGKGGNGDRGSEDEG